MCSPLYRCLKSLNKAYKTHGTPVKTRSYADLRELIYKEEYDKKKERIENEEIIPEENQFIYEDENYEVPEFNELLVPEIILHGEDDFETFSGEKLTVRQVTGKAHFRPSRTNPGHPVRDKIVSLERNVL